MNAKKAVHLHCHSEYSSLDGASKIEEMVKAAAADGQPALGLTDHGNMSGAVPFYDACKKHGVNPVIGEELYMAYEHVDDRPKKKNNIEDDSGGETNEGRKLYFHLIALAENNEGYKNLIQLSSRAFLEGYYYKPRVDWNMLEQHSSGLIVTSACLGGHVLQHLLRHEDELAYEKAGRLQDIFGRDNFFIEIQDHGLSEQRLTNPKLLEISKALNAPLLATNDTHYTHAGDAKAHDSLLCIQTKSRLSDKDRFRFESEEHYLKSSEEMHHLFRDYPGAVDNSLWIGERANVELEYGKDHLPKFDIPEGFTTDAEYLKHLTLEGIKERERVHGREDDYIDRIMYELKVIEDMGFSSYFLITWDLVKYAKSRNIMVGPGRGSAGGCAVAYALRITDLDPVKYDLLFERFLNPSRISMPDIDMDFDSRYRDEMINYTRDKYGEDRVAQIITFSTIKARGSVRDAARVLDYPFSLGDKIAKLMPPLIAGRDTPLWACFEETDKYAQGFGMAVDLRNLVNLDPEAAEVVEVARGLEDLRKSDGQHPAAVVISPEPITNFLPVQQKPGKPLTTQYEMDYVEKLGLLKMDFLAVKNLDIIQDTLGSIKENYGIELDALDIPLDDQKTFDLLSAGQGIGLFQLESAQMRALMRSLQPDSFDDVAALIALYRPGPMAANMHNDYADRKNGRKPVEYLHPDAEEVLGDTYGLMIYQEELMRIAQKFAGFSLAEADNLRKGVGKKIPEVVAKARDGFVQGCIDEGYGVDLGNEWFDIIEPFADYAFNKSHSYGYGMVSYWTAYLKANYPSEYMAALLTSSDSKKLPVYLNEAAHMGLTVTAPDINLSSTMFIASSLNGQPVIPFGLGSISHVGVLSEDIIQERKTNGLYTSIQDFCTRVDSSNLTSKTIDALVKAGCFDSIHGSRNAVLKVAAPSLEAARKQRKKHSKNAMQLFDMTEIDGEVPDIETSREDILKYEKELLGLYVTYHPLEGYEDKVREMASIDIVDIKDCADKSKQRLVGIITKINRKTTRSGDNMAVLTIEDFSGECEIVLFKDTLIKYQEFVDNEKVLVFDGKVNKREEFVSLILDHVEEVDNMKLDPLILFLSNEGMTEAVTARLSALFNTYPGDYPVILDTGSTTFDLGVSISKSEEMMEKLQHLLKGC